MSYCAARVCFSGVSGHDLVWKFAFAVANGGKADMAGAFFRFALALPLVFFLVAITASRNASLG
jgi:hypothetical protein